MLPQGRAGDCFMIKPRKSTFGSVPGGGNAAGHSPTSRTGPAGLDAPSVDRRADAGDAYGRLWELVNELEGELRSAQRKYPPYNSRIDRLFDLRLRVLFALLPYEQPKLKIVDPPAVAQLDHSKLTDEELHELGRLLSKMEGAVPQTAPKPAATAGMDRRADSKAAPAASGIPTRPDTSHFRRGPRTRPGRTGNP
jgi:hypothetical protein